MKLDEQAINQQSLSLNIKPNDNKITKLITIEEENEGIEKINSISTNIAHHNIVEPYQIFMIDLKKLTH